LVSAGERMPTLKSLDRTRQVVHLGSYAKTLFPGARVGFVIADQLVRDADGTTTLLALELGKVKSMVTVNTSSLSQAAVAGMLLDADGMLSTANAEATARYDQCRRTMLGRLDDLMPPARAEALGVSWNRPKGGFFLAMRVAFRADNTALERSAERHSVIWTPMSYFHPRGGGEFTMRLAFSNLTTAQIEEGVRRLVDFFAAEREAGGEPADNSVAAPAAVAG
jgi:(S)-3,5-dihydroxyphenylglycine transaminase